MLTVETYLNYYIFKKTNSSIFSDKQCQVAYFSSRNLESRAKYRTSIHSSGETPSPSPPFFTGVPPLQGSTPLFLISSDPPFKGYFIPFLQNFTVHKYCKEIGCQIIIVELK